MTEHRQSLGRGAAFMVGSALLFALMGVAVKVSSLTLPNTMVVFFRSGLGLVALLPWLFRLGPAGLRTSNMREHWIRGVAGLGSMYCYFYAVAHMRLADAVLINYSTPLFMPFVESAWLGEPLPRRLFSPIALGFLGIVLILRPGPGLFEPAALVAVLAALCASVAQVGVRRLTHTEPVTRIVFYFAVISTVVSAAPVPFVFRMPERGLWLVLLGLGLSATLGQLFLTRAYAHAPATHVGPFMYSAVVFAATLDWALWGRLPDRWSVAGALLVVSAGILALRRHDPPVPAPATPA